MDEANENKTSSGMERLSLQPNRFFPRDLLQGLMGSDEKGLELGKTVSNEEDSEEIELNLGLSLGGRFGVDKSEKKRLMRSSSIAGEIPMVRDDDAVAPRPPVPYPALVRTSSLPAESEQEWRKRKELQTLRRMEAKRRRCEKQRSLKIEKDGGGGGSGGGGGGEEERREIEEVLRGRVEREQSMATANRFGSAMVPMRLPSWAAATAARARQGIVSGGIEAVAAGKGKGTFVGGDGGGGGGVEGIGQRSSQNSMESQGGSSSGMSELESKPLQGSNSFREASPATLQSFEDRANQDTGGSSGTKPKENVQNDVRISAVEIASPSKRPNAAETRGREVGAKAVEDMPCVFTKGDGPNGRRIDGILYKYGKGAEVRIMCVCHGIFLSPAEFVKHAGGGDVANPLKHIVVNPNSSF